MELLAFPAVGRVVVTLGTLDLNAKEDARHLGGSFFRAAILGHNDCGVSIFFDITTGSDELGCDTIPANPFVELPCKVGDHCVAGGDFGTVFLCAKEDNVVPVAGPVLSVVRIVEQGLHELFAFVAGRIKQESNHRFEWWNVAHQVERNPP